MPHKKHPYTKTLILGRSIGRLFPGEKRFCATCVKVNSACPDSHVLVTFHAPRLRVPKETDSNKVWEEFLRAALWYEKNQEALALALKNLQKL